MEYRYAIASGKPGLAFIHADPDSLSARKTKRTDIGKQRLPAFRELVKQRLCKTWNTPAELGSVVSRSLIRPMRTTPGIGWVRADAVPDKSVANEIVRLRQWVEELEMLLDDAAARVPEGTEHLAQGSDLYKIFHREKYDYTNTVKGGLHIAWSDIFSRVAPLMIDEARASDLAKSIGGDIKERLGAPPGPGLEPTERSFASIIVQFRALGLIAKSQKKRSLKDRETYWNLTPYGNAMTTRLWAIGK